MVYLIGAPQYRVSEVRIVEGPEAEPGHKKRPNRNDWAFILPAVIIDDSLERAPPDRSSP